MDSPSMLVVSDLLDLAPIVPGTLGHVTALKSPDARVVVLSFEAGYVMKEHATPKTLLLQALDGHLRFTAEGRTVELVPGGVVRLNPLVRHEVEAVVDSRLMLTLIG